MHISEFDYELPPELIAQQPLPDRSASKLLVVERSTGRIQDRMFADLPELLAPGDLLVLNNTRVIRARLFGRREGVHAQRVSPRNPAAREFLTGTVEVLLARRLSEDTWLCLVHPGRKVRVGERLHFADDFEAEVIGRGEFGERTLLFRWTGDFWERLERHGHVPLPPYIHREDAAADAERYQTIYARQPGSVAAPTAGLHFTRGILDRMRARGMETAEITLDVGLGTFQPVRVANIEAHRTQAEPYEITSEFAAAVNRALDQGRRIVAVGTTSVRVLEHAAIETGRIQAGSGETTLFIYPGFRFRATGALLTNFHLPRSTLLMLVCAFAGHDLTLAAYRHAVERRYRFYSYGDASIWI